jgi:hypothetical protein
MVTCDHYEDRRATVLAPTPPHNKHTHTHTHGQTVRTDQQDARGGGGGEGKMSKESGRKSLGFRVIFLGEFLRVPAQFWQPTICCCTLKTNITISEDI